MANIGGGEDSTIRIDPWETRSLSWWIPVLSCRRSSTTLSNRVLDFVCALVNENGREARTLYPVNLYIFFVIFFFIYINVWMHPWRHNSLGFFIFLIHKRSVDLLSSTLFIHIFFFLLVSLATWIYFGRN